MYRPHPSAELNALFGRKPYQGAEPARAMFLFVGLDANYEDDIGHRPIFQSVREYHRDGVAFWRRRGVHHPFLLPGYTGGGRLYHRSFARIGFRPEHAHLVSFSELLHVPTVGRNRLKPVDLNREHLAWLSKAIVDGDARHVFVSSAVATLMRASKAFPWLPRSAVGSTPDFEVLYRQGEKTVYSHLHFSAYGMFEAKKASEARAIGELFALERRR